MPTNKRKNLLPGIRASWLCPCADTFKPRVNVILTLSKLGSYREALGGIHLPALNLRFKGYAGNGILGSILISAKNIFN